MIDIENSKLTLKKGKKMKNIIQSILVYLFSISIFSSANAGTLTVTGTAKATYNIVSGFSNVEKGIGVSNDLDFTGTGQTALGKFTYQVQQESSAGAMNIVDQQLVLVTGYGTVGAFVSEGNLSQQNAGSRSVYGRPTDTDGGIAAEIDNTGINSYNNMQYHLPAGLLPFGIGAKIAYAPDANANLGAKTNSLGTTRTVTGANAGNATSYQITAAPIKGFAIGADYLNHGEAGNAANRSHQNDESGAVFLKYDIGAIGIGASKALHTPAQAMGTANTVEYYDQLNYSVSFLVNPNLSISYEQEISERKGASVLDGVNARTKTADVKNKSNGIQAAYTVGGVTLAVAHNQHDNVGYATGKDADNTVFAVTMAF